jgi:hypothetical protein
MQINEIQIKKGVPAHAAQSHWLFTAAQRQIANGQVPGCTLPQIVRRNKKGKI